MIPHWTFETTLIYCFITAYLYFSLSRLSLKKHVLMEQPGIARKFKFFVLAIIPTFFAVFRYISYPVGGTDAAWYVRAYNNTQLIPINGYTLFGDQDLLFNNFMYLVRQISSDYRFYFFVVYLFMILTVYYFVYEIFDEVACFAPLIYLIYYYLQMYNILRFMLGLSIMVVAYVAISKDRRIIGIILSIVAILTHSALILGALAVFVYVLLKRFANKRAWVLAGVAVAYVLFFVFQGRIVSYFVSTTYRAYTERGQSLIGQLMPIICMLLCAIFYKPLVEEYNANRFMIYLVFFEAACIPIAMNLGYSRVHTVFLLPRLYTWGIIIELIGDKVRMHRLCIQTSYLVAIAWTLFRFSRDWYTAGWMPYILNIFGN